MDRKRSAHHLTIRILIAMAAGCVIGIALRFIPLDGAIKGFIVEGVLTTGGAIFITILKMLVVPVVLVSLVCGSSQLDLKRFGRVGLKTLGLYLFTTALAICIALVVSSAFGVGKSVHLTAAVHYVPQVPPSFKHVLLNLFPSNPFKALVDGEMLQIIIFSIMFGMALSVSGDSGKKVLGFFESANQVIIKLILMIMSLAPYGVFCLIASLFAKIGFQLIAGLFGYFFVVLLVLFIQLSVVYTSLLISFTRLNPIKFIRKMYAAMLFAFSVSSSNASIPVVLETVRDKLGVKNSIASFTVPLGATINMDGTAIMQGVATVFIAHAYHVSLGLMGYLTVISMATLASIGTAGVPSVGLITLAMVLKQVGLPVEGIGLIIGIDRLLDMARTAVNITGDSVVACIVGKTEDALDKDIFNAPSDQLGIDAESKWKFGRS